jgi:hypothetical protein
MLVRLVRYEETVVLGQHRGQERAFAPWTGTQVKPSLALDNYLCFGE